MLSKQSNIFSYKILISNGVQARHIVSYNRNMKLIIAYLHNAGFVE